ncbi:MAG: HAD family hydrolase [Candidatus Obscuribacterales bacterium]|nr:HAD family hydrolase [Candidatus Obscuribacterales bacterium]
MQLESIDNFIFDFDHTLIDTDTAFATYRRVLLEQLHLHSRLACDQLEAALADTETRLESCFFANRLDLISGLIGNKLSRDLNEMDRRKIALVVNTSYHACLRPNHAILSMLEDSLKLGKNLFLFTAGSPAHTIDKLRGSALWRYFKCVFTGDLHPFEDSVDSGLTDVAEWQGQMEDRAPVLSLGPNPKSDRRGYLSLLACANIKADRSLMIGNSLKDDVQNAHAAGFYAAQATWFHRDVLETVIPDMVLTAPSSLIIH